MSQTPAPSAAASLASSRASRVVALVVVVAFFIGISLVTYRNTQALRETAVWVSHTHEVIVALNDVLSLMKDAETGQRGFLVTGEEKIQCPLRR